jgi:hypothetical protein
VQNLQYNIIVRIKIIFYIFVLYFYDITLLFQPVYRWLDFCTEGEARCLGEKIPAIRLTWIFVRQARWPASDCRSVPARRMKAPGANTDILRPIYGDLIAGLTAGPL